jgi:hypothetical protein
MDVMQFAIYLKLHVKDRLTNKIIIIIIITVFTL